VVLLSSCWVVLKARKLLSVVIGTPVNCEPPVVPATVVLGSSPQETNMIFIILMTFMILMM